MEFISELTGPAIGAVVGIGGSLLSFRKKAKRLWSEGQDVVDKAKALTTVLKNARADDGKIDLNEAGQIIEVSGQLVQEIDEFRVEAGKVF